MYGIFTYIWLMIKVNAGKYTSPMDGMGYVFDPTCYHSCIFVASNCADKLRYYVAMEGQSWGNGKVASHYGGCYHAVLLPNLLFEPPVYS